jgi:hypothetical protein
MKRISTEFTVHLKWAPFIFWPVLVVVFLLLIANGAYDLAPSLLVGMGIAALFGVVNHYHTKAIRRNLVDAVFDCGNSLLLRRGREEETVPFSNIANVNFMTEPARITLQLSTPGKFGGEVAFIPPPQLYFGPIPENEIANDLTARAVKARSTGSH